MSKFTSSKLIKFVLAFVIAIGVSTYTPKAYASSGSSSDSSFFGLSSFGSSIIESASNTELTITSIISRIVQTNLKKEYRTEFSEPQMFEIINMKYNPPAQNIVERFSSLPDTYTFEIHGTNDNSAYIVEVPHDLFHDFRRDRENRIMGTDGGDVTMFIELYADTKVMLFTDRETDTLIPIPVVAYGER